MHHPKNKAERRRIDKQKKLKKEYGLDPSPRLRREMLEIQEDLDILKRVLAEKENYRELDAG